MNKESEAALERAILDAIDHARGSMTYYQVVGALEFIKARMIEEAGEEE